MIKDIKYIEGTDEMQKAYDAYWQQFDEDELYDDQDLVNRACKVALEEAIQASTQIQDLIAENKRLKSEIIKLVAELVTLKEQNQWQPIETAPKDCELLGWYYSKGSINYMIIIWFNDRWISIGINDIEECPQPPTHWRPIPQPPKELK